MPDQNGSQSPLENDPPIITSGGSVTVDFGTSHGKFQHDGRGKHYNADKKIERIVVKGAGLDIDQLVPDGKITIEVYYG